MIRFKLIKRLPKKPLLGLAVLALALVAAGGGATPARAQTATSYTIELSFETITFPAIDDCEWSARCSRAELYGTLNGRTTSTGVGSQGARNIATWENSAGCENGWILWWDEAAPCLKLVDAGTVYRFAETPMCASNTHLFCTGNYQLSNNKIRLTVKPGEQIRAGIHLYDYDKLSSDDDACAVTRWVGPFTATELAYLNKTGLGMGMAFNGDAGCTVTFSLKRVI